MGSDANIISKHKAEELGLIIEVCVPIELKNILWNHFRGQKESKYFIKLPKYRKR